MKEETYKKYKKAKSLVNAADNVSGIIGMIETKNGLEETGIFVGISQDNIDWLVSVCKERYNDLLRQLDEL